MNEIKFTKYDALETFYMNTNIKIFVLCIVFFFFLWHKEQTCVALSVETSLLALSKIF